METGEKCRDAVWRREAAAELAVPHSPVTGENQEGYLGSKRSQPRARPHRPGFQCQEEKSP